MISKHDFSTDFQQVLVNGNLKYLLYHEKTKCTANLTMLSQKILAVRKFWGDLRRCGAATMARLAWVRMITLGIIVIGGVKC